MKRQSKMDREILEPMRTRLEHYRIALRDLVVGDVPRGGTRIRVGVKAGEFGDHERFEATILRPLGAYPLVLVRESDSVELIPVDEWSAPQESDPLALKVLKERALVILRRATEADQPAPAHQRSTQGGA